MKKAAIVMATLVAFLLSGGAFAARKTITDFPSTQSIFSGNGTAATSAGVLTVGGALIGEYLPAPTNKAISLIPEASVSVAGISGLAKNVIKGGVAGLAAGYAFDELIKGVGWVIDSAGTVQKTDTSTSPTVHAGGSFHGYNESEYGVYTYSDVDFYVIVQSTNAVPAGCTYANNRNPYYDMNCPGVYTPPKATLIPLTDGDYNVLDGFVQGQDGVWQRDLTTELCNGSDTCYQGLNPTTAVSGPTTVTGTPTTLTTTSSSGSVTTTTKTPTTTITYGSNYYDYTTTTTTTTTNNGGDNTTTTDDTDTSLPAVPDLLGTANDGIGGIRDGIPTTASTASPLPYMPWYSFSQSCTEVTFTLPYYGPVTTDNCPIYQKYIWPTLYFIFAVFTWITCWNIWRSTVLRVRAS